MNFYKRSEQLKGKELKDERVFVLARTQLLLKARSHDPLLRIRFLLVPKNGSCEHIKNDLPSNGSVI